MIPAIDAELQARGFAALTADLAGLDRAGASTQTWDEKQAGVRPMDCLVLIAMRDPQWLAAVSARLYPSGGGSRGSATSRPISGNWICLAMIICW